MRDMFPAACACGIGFTVSFLIASLAYQDAELSAESRFGVLIASLIAAVISGILLSRQSKRFEAAQRQLLPKRTTGMPMTAPMMRLKPCSKARRHHCRQPDDWHAERDGSTRRRCQAPTRSSSFDGGYKKTGAGRGERGDETFVDSRVSSSVRMATIWRPCWRDSVRHPRIRRFESQHVGEDDDTMGFEQAGRLFKGSVIVTWIAGNDNQIVGFGIQPRQKHSRRRVHRTSVV